MKRCQLVHFLCLLASLCAAVPARAQSNGVLREVWLDIGGSAVADLTNSATFPNNPSFDGVLTNGFEAPTDVYDNYGQRLRALLIPPTTGSYHFLIASDDNSQLFLSTNDTPAGKRLVAHVLDFAPLLSRRIRADVGSGVLDRRPALLPRSPDEGGRWQ